MPDNDAEFPIINVEPDDPVADEPMGTKFKFWLESKEDGSQWLFKQSREGCGDDWAEKLAAHLAGMLGLPHAEYELATFQNKCPGVLSRSFLDGHELYHGNEILFDFTAGYPDPADTSQHFERVPQHTIGRVFEALKKLPSSLPLHWKRPDGIRTTIDLFIGYLFLDCWIGNQDRHHQNWGIVYDMDFGVSLAPTFDHASSLGWNLTDFERKERLTTKDKNRTVEAFATRGRSAFYASEKDPKELLLVDALKLGAEHSPSGYKSWREQLASVDLSAVDALIRRVPRKRMSKTAMEFASRLLECNRRRILEL